MFRDAFVRKDTRGDEVTLHDITDEETDSSLQSDASACVCPGIYRRQKVDSTPQNPALVLSRSAAIFVVSSRGSAYVEPSREVTTDHSFSTRLLLVAI